jgi:hypothetical protein
MAWRADMIGFVGVVLSLLFCRGKRGRGKISNIVFPIQVGDLTGANGPELLSKMLRQGGHLPHNVHVASITDVGAGIRDGVKGDKAVINVEYRHETSQTSSLELPEKFFVKFNLQSISQLPMRILCESSEVCKCEAMFYHLLSRKVCFLYCSQRVLLPIHRLTL